MARELTESRKALVDMLLEQLKKEDLINREERINKQVIELKKELSDIVDRAYQSQVSKVIGEFQEKLSDNTLSEEERTSIEQERKEFEENPAIKGVVAAAALYALAYILKLDTILWLLSVVAPGLVIAFAVIFQPEIRKLFLRIGQSSWFAFGKRSKHTYVDSVLLAAEMLSKERRGMLAVFMRHTKLDNYMQAGTKLNADLSSSLLVTIYGKDTPLHDDACFIQG